MNIIKAVFAFAIQLCICITGQSQQVEGIFELGANGYDHVRSIVTDNDDNLYVLGRGGGNLEISGEEIISPYNGTQTYLVKLDANKELVWVKFFDYNNHILNYNTHIVIDSAHNVYVSDNYVNSAIIDDYEFYAYGESYLTFKLNESGELEWAINAGGEKIRWDVNGYIEIMQFNTPNDSLAGEHILNEGSCVAWLNYDGEYINHMYYDDPNYAIEVFQGRNSDGLIYGHRRSVIINNNKLELFMVDSLGNFINSNVLGYSWYYTNPNSVEYFPESDSYYLTSLLYNRTPFDAPTGTNESILYLIKTDGDFNIIDTLKMGGTESGYFPDIDINIIEGDVYLAGKINNSGSNNSKWTHFGQSNYLYPQSDELIFAKLNSDLNLKWFRKIPPDFFNCIECQILNPIVYSGGIMVYGIHEEFEMDGHIFDAWQYYTDIFMLDVTDLDSTNISIAGKIFQDVDQDGEFSDNDLPLLYQKVENEVYNPNLYHSYLNGNYTVPGVMGQQSINIVDIPLYWVMSTEDSVLVEITSSDTVVENVNFGMYPIPGVVDITTEITALTAARPGFDVEYLIEICNIGTDTADANFMLVQDAGLNFISADLEPDSVSSDSLYFTLPQLSPNSCFQIHVIDSLDANTNLLSSTLHLIGQATATVNDTVPEDNFDHLMHWVTGAYDPNDISVNTLCNVSESFVENSYLEYLIRFQNTGSDTAFTVTIKNLLTENLNPASFEFVTASNPVEITIEDSLLSLQFNNILLPDSTTNLEGSKGYFKYRIKASPSISTGDIIESTADIFFDFNPPITTNTATTHVIPDTDLVDVNVISTGCAEGNITFISECFYPFIEVKLDSGNYAYNSSGVLENVPVGPHLVSFTDGLDTVTFNILVSPQVITHFANTSICSGDSIFAGGYYQSNPGSYVDTLQTALGCDSIITTNLEVLSSESAQAETICQGDSIFIANEFQTSSGTYVDTLQTSMGCDSIVTTFLEVYVIDNTLTIEGTTIISNSNNADYQWINCENDSIIPGENDQDFTATTNGNYAVLISQNGCSNLSSCQEINLTGIIQNDLEQNIKVFPNPTSGKLNIQLGEIAERLTVTVSDNQGKLISNHVFDNITLILLDLAGSAGIYVISLKDSDGKEARIRVVKQ